MLAYISSEKANKRHCKITEQLIKLSKKGYSMPWITKEGIAPFQRLILEELIKAPMVPGSIRCKNLLEEKFRIDEQKIIEAANEVLHDDEQLNRFTFCKVVTRALEKEIIFYLDKDIDWSEKLLARYAACMIIASCCHVESVNDLLSITYKAEQTFAKYPLLRIAHLLDVIEAWKSGVICGIVEQCIKAKNEFAFFNRPLCNDFIETLEHVASLYTDIKNIRKKLSRASRFRDEKDIEAAVSHLESACNDLLNTITKVTPIVESNSEEEKSSG